MNNKPVLDALYQKLPYFTEKQINCLSDLLPRILFQNAIEIENDSFITEITDYIEQNLNNELTVELLCSKFFISKNRLYEAFHSHFNSTVNEYITDRRMVKAKELLKNTKEPIYKIAEDVGIENYTYFCKLFKRKTGLTPTEYRTAPQN
ncbi:MAG: helix-turn-helix transcriptional regulator [Ruminococcaceae bacterium]|nr:helix-turn-helix transcriptional regulator [Oscillospiraceae bacterium]